VLTNLRVLKYGFSDNHDRGPSHSTMIDPFGSTTVEQVLGLLKNCPRLEELYLNTDLPEIDTLFAAKRLGAFASCNTTTGSADTGYATGHPTLSAQRAGAE